MKIPNADKGVIAEDKIRVYLLNLGHRRGEPKAQVLVALGYAADEWKRLANDLRAQHLTTSDADESDSEYGKRYEVVAPLRGPNGREFDMRKASGKSTWEPICRVLSLFIPDEPTMPIELYQDVILTKPLPEYDLYAGDVGVAVDRHSVPGKEPGYSVEFFDMTGRTVAVVTVVEHFLRVPTPDDRPSTRQLVGASTWKLNRRSTSPATSGAPHSRPSASADLRS